METIERIMFVLQQQQPHKQKHMFSEWNEKLEIVENWVVGDCCTCVCVKYLKIAIENLRVRVKEREEEREKENENHIAM